MLDVETNVLLAISNWTDDFFEMPAGSAVVGSGMLSGFCTGGDCTK